MSPHGIISCASIHFAAERVCLTIHALTFPWTMSEYIHPYNYYILFAIEQALFHGLCFSVTLRLVLSYLSSPH